MSIRSFTLQPRYGFGDFRSAWALGNLLGLDTPGERQQALRQSFRRLLKREVIRGQRNLHAFKSTAHLHGQVKRRSLPSFWLRLPMRLFYAAFEDRQNVVGQDRRSKTQ